MTDCGRTLHGGPPGLLALCLALAACAAPAADRAGADGSASAPPQLYTVHFEVAGDAALRGSLEHVSGLLLHKARPSHSLAALIQRAGQDRIAMEQVLRSLGYYAGMVAVQVEPVPARPAPGGLPGPVRVVIRAEAGPQYGLSAFDVIYTDAADPALDRAPASAFALGLASGAPALGETIVQYTDKAAAWLREHGYPAARVESREVVVDRAAVTVRVQVRVRAGERTRFGPLTIAGLRRTREDYVRDLVSWEAGALYDVRRVAGVRDALKESGLFDDVDLHATGTGGGVVPWELVLHEHPARSIGGGVRWSTGEGYGLRGFWEHRNLFGAAERGRVAANYGGQLKDVTLTLRKPRFRRPDQTLQSGLEVAEENTDAFFERRLKVTAGLSREFSENTTGSLGVSAQVLRADAQSPVPEYRLVGLPASLRRFHTDDLLNPTRGWRISAQVTPWAGTGNGRVAFVRALAGGSFYLTPGFLRALTWANRLRAGTIGAGSLEETPKSLRFYAGGGGSVRGFAFQKAGEVDGGGVPVGGRSLLEVSSELRVRMSQTLGGVVFLDGGGAYERAVPWGERLFWGWGVGGRYYTSAGPVRMDVAFPLRRRDGIDDPFQVYVSLGQAF